MYFKLSLVLGIFLIIDIVGHLCLKIKRKLIEWLLLSFISVGAVVFLTVGIMGMGEKDKKNGASIYMAYKYLADGNVDQARLKLIGAGAGYGVKADVLDAMADLVDKNYVQGYFKTQRLLSDGALSATDKKFVSEVQQICMNELGIGQASVADETGAYHINKEKNDDKKDTGNEENDDNEKNSSNEENNGDERNNNEKNNNREKYNDYEEYIKVLSAEDDSYAVADIADDEKDEEAVALIKEYIDTLDFSDKEVLEYTKEYELDSKLNATDIEQITPQDIEEIKDNYGDTEEVKRLECKYYVYENDYENAKEKALELVKSNRSEENYVIYTDIIAQEAYEKEQKKDNMYEKPDNEFYDLTDAEVRKLVKKADKKIEQAEEICENYDEEQEEVKNQIDKLEEEADELYTEAIYVDVKRSINYIIAKKPADGDDTGIYDLQLAKLYLVEGDRDTASKYLYKVIDNSVDISDDSAIKEALEEVVSQYNQITGDEYNAELNAAITELVKAQSNNVVGLGAGTVNGSFQSYVSNSLKYDKINIHISKIDTENYPTVRAYININGNKDGKSELASEFKEKDFSLIDTQYEINDFKLIRDENSNNVSIAIVMDHSGSMDGTPLSNAKAAAIEAIGHMDTKTQKIAIIAYDDTATVEQKLSDKEELLKRAVNNIGNGGGTNISSGLLAGIDEIKDEAGSRAIILMSDGRDGGSAQSMENAVSKAIDEGICVYTVAFGDCDEEYMKSIAEATGGKYMKASDSSDLADIYLTLQRYIVNNYCIEYEVKKNVETDPRYLTVNITEYSTSSTKEYYLDEENKPEEENEKDGIEKTDEDTIGISSVSPNGISVQAVADGVEVTITGGGFDDGVNVVIGNIPLSNVKVQDKTTLTGTLKGTLNAGQYDIQVKTQDGRLAIANRMFKVFKSGSTTSIRLGCTTITADTIGQTGDHTLVASGNVMVNGFIHSAGDMQIDVNGMNSDIDLKKNTSVYVGDSGSLSGQSKLYVSYKQMEESNGDFASLVMAGKDYVIQNSQYYANVGKSDTSFDTSVADFNLKIPFIMDIDVAEVNLYHNRLQVDIKTFNLSELVDDIKQSLKHQKGENKPEPKIKKRSETNRFDVKDAGDLGLSLAITPDGIQFGGEMKVNVNDALNFGNFGINEVSLKLNSLDADKEYWKIGGKFDFGRAIKGFAETGIDGFEGSFSSYYWLPDKLSIKCSLKPGITVYNIIEINSIDGSMQGISTIALKLYESIVSPDTYKILGTNIDSDAYDYQDVILEAGIGADANLFSSFKGENKLFNKFKEWGQIGKIDGDVSINFSEPEFKIAARMDLLGSEKASAEAKINSSGLDVAADIDLALSGFGMELSGGADANVGGNLTGGYIKLGVDGKVSCPVLGINSNGEASVKVELDWDFDKAAVTVNYQDGGVNKEGSLWYEDNGELFLWQKIHTSSN